MTARSQLLLGGMLQKRWNTDLRNGCVLTAVLTTLLSGWFMVTRVLHGENYSPFVVQVTGIDASEIANISIRYQSPFGSKGVLEYDGETGLFRTQNWPQPIARLFVDCPKNTALGGLAAELWFVSHSSVEYGLSLNRGGRKGRLIPETHQAAGEDRAGYELIIDALSPRSLSRYGVAMNWKGDVPLVVGSILRALMISFGMVLCGMSTLSLICAFQMSQLPAGFRSDCKEETGIVRKRRIAGWVFLIVVIGGILYMRDSDVFLWPAMEVEDGSLIFAHFYTERSASEIFRFKMGYLPLIPNMMGFISARIPCQSVPYFMSLIPAGVAAVVYTLGFRGCCERFFPGRVSAWFTCVVVCLAPFGSHHMHSSTDYMIWNLLGLLLLTCIADPDCGKWGSMLLTGLLCGLVWSHPLSVVILPILAIKWVFQGTLRSCWVFVAGAALLYYCFGVEQRTGILGIGLQERVAEYMDVAASAVTISIESSLRALLGSRFYGAIFSGPLAFWVVRVAGLVVILWVCIAWRRGSVLKMELLLIVAAIWGITFASLVGRGMESVSDFEGRPRYIYVQSVLCIFCVSTFLFRGLDSVIRRSFPDAERVRYHGSVLLGCSLLGWFGYTNHQAGYLFPGGDKSGAYSYSDPANGRIMEKFMRDLAVLEQDPTLNGEFLLEAVKVNDWKVVIDTRKKAGVQTP